MNFDEKIREDRESLIADIVKLVSINSVEGTPKEGMPFGEGAAEALECFLSIAEEAGLHTENFDNYAGHAELGDGEETLGILGHVDVVPCGEGWVCDPFTPQIIDGKLYGRGVLDNKGPMLVCLHAVKILKEMGIPLRKKIRFIVGANEETDWKCMDYYFGVKKNYASGYLFYTGCGVSAESCRKRCLSVSDCDRSAGKNRAFRWKCI